MNPDSFLPRNKEKSEGVKDGKGQGVPSDTPPLEYNPISKTPIIDGLEEPLFVLRYSKWNVRLGEVVIFLFVAWVCGGMFFYYEPPETTPWPLGLKGICLVGFIVCIWIIIKQLLFKDIKLYKNRIVENYHFLGQKEVKLEEAYISKRKPISYLLNQPTVISQKKLTLFSRGAILIMEDLAKIKDIKEFYSILAELSGRDVKDFDCLGKIDLGWAEKLIKGGNEQ